jgi:hypothetical protein
MIEQGITPAIVDWPVKSKHWFYVHGGMLHPATWQIIRPTDEAWTNLLQKLLKLEREISTPIERTTS